MGGRSSSSSASTTNNQDNRVAVQDGIGLSASSGNVINITDGGVVDRGLDTVDLALVGTLGTVDRAIGTVDNVIGGALDSVNVANAINADSFTRLLDAAENLWDRGEGLIGQTQKAVADAYSQATSDKAGTIDNRTVIVLAVAGAAALAFANRRN